MQKSLKMGLLIFFIGLPSLFVFQNCTKGFQSVSLGPSAGNSWLSSQPGSQVNPPNTSTTTTTSTVGTTPAPTPSPSTTTRVSLAPFQELATYDPTQTGFLPAFNPTIVETLSIGHANDGSVRAIAFVPANGNSDGTYSSIYAYNRTNPTPVWMQSFNNTGVMPVFDWDGDGVPDFLYTETVSNTTSVVCINDNGLPDGSQVPLHATELVMRSGATGSLLFDFGSTPDFCFKDTLDPANPIYEYLQQWTIGGVVANEAERSLAVSQTYAQATYVIRQQPNGSAQMETITFPSVQAYDSYTNANYPLYYGLNPPHKYADNSHIMNGLFIGGILQFFTSGRFVQYSALPLTPDPTQLALDLSFIAGGVNEGAGRNYGLVEKDPQSSNIVNISGCTVRTLLDDTVNNVTTQSVREDQNCGILRKIAVIDTARQTLVGSAFYSYLHDGGNFASAYVNRVTFPSHAYLQQSSSGLASIIYNSYINGHWYMHISVPGGTDDASRTQDMVVWDVADIDRDGVDEVIYSPMNTSGNAYFPQRTTYIGHFVNGSLEIAKTLTGYLPYLAPSPKRDLVSNTDVALFSVARVYGQAASIYMYDSTNKVVPIDYIATQSNVDWGAPVVTTLRCQYPSETPTGVQRSGGCATVGQQNIYQYGAEAGSCTPPTIVRRQGVQTCTQM